MLIADAKKLIELDPTFPKGKETMYEIYVSIFCDLTHHAMEFSDRLTRLVEERNNKLKDEALGFILI